MLFRLVVAMCPDAQMETGLIFGIRCWGKSVAWIYIVYSLFALWVILGRSLLDLFSQVRAAHSNCLRETEFWKTVAPVLSHVLAGAAVILATSVLLRLAVAICPDMQLKTVMIVGIRLWGKVVEWSYIVYSLALLVLILGRSLLDLLLHSD